MAKYKLTLFVFVIISFNIYAQTLKPDIITTAGDYYTNSTGSLSWTFGEPVVETYIGGSNVLTQGFQQSSYLITSVEAINEPQMDVSAYPNPTSDLITIKSDESKPLNADMMDMEGKNVYKSILENGQGEMNLTHLANGIYFLRICDENGKQIHVFKIQKVK